MKDLFQFTLIILLLLKLIINQQGSKHSSLKQKMFTSQSKNNKNSQGLLQNSTQRILQTSPTAATLKSFNHYGSSKQIPPLVSINGEDQNDVNGHSQESKKIKPNEQEIRDSGNNGGWGQGIVSKFKQIKTQKNRNMNMNKKIEKVSQNSPSKHVYNVNMNRRISQSAYENSPPALITNSSPTELQRNEAEHENNELQKLQSVAQSVYLDLQQYSSIHKYESISPNYEDFQEDKQYVKYLIKNDEYGNPMKPTNYRMMRMPRQSINLQSQDSITKSYRNSSNIPNIPQLQLHTQLSSPIKNFNDPDLMDETQKMKMQETNHRMSTPTRQSNRAKTKNEVKYPYIAKYLSLQPQNNPIPDEQQLQSDVASSPMASIPPVQKIEQETKNISDNMKGQNLNQLPEPNMYSGQFKHIDQLESLNSRNQNNYFNRVTLQVYQHYLGEPHSGKYQPHQNQSSILINTSSNNASGNNPLKSPSIISIQNLKTYPYIQNMNNYKINEDVELQTPEWLQNRSAQHTLRLILTKNTKLTQYLRYLSELQIKLKHKNTYNYLQKTQKRNDIQFSPKQLIDQQIKQRQIQQQKYLNKKSITIYYDTEQDRRNSKEKSSSNSNSKGKTNPSNLQINNRNKSSRLQSNNLQNPPEKASNRKQSLFSNNSDNVQSLNVFNTKLSNSAYLPKNSPKLNKYKNQLQQIQSQEGESNIYIKNDHNHNNYRIKTKQIQVLKILQTLLVKLSDKKCNVLVKDQAMGSTSNKNRHEGENVDRDERSIRNRSQNYLSSSRRVESEVFGLNKWTQTEKKPKSFLKQERIQIEFEQYLQNNPHYKFTNEKLTCSTKLTTYSQKIKELSDRLQNKQKYVEEIKSSYDYIINNYITTIINLKNMVNKNPGDNKSNGSNNSRTNNKKSVKNNVSNRTSKKTLKRQKTTIKNQSQQQNIIVSEQQYSSCEQFKESQKDTHNKLELDMVDNFRSSQPITFKMSRANDSLEEEWIGSANGTLDPGPNVYEDRYWYSERDQNI